jgi:hypothetical protein
VHDVIVAEQPEVGGLLLRANLTVYIYIYIYIYILVIDSMCISKVRFAYCLPCAYLVSGRSIISVAVPKIDE